MNTKKDDKTVSVEYSLLCSFWLSKLDLIIWPNRRHKQAERIVRLALQQTGLTACQQVISVRVWISKQ